MNAPMYQQKLERAVALGAAMAKVGIVVGGSGLILYSLHIGRFPQGLTVGDGLLLIMVAGCVGVLFASLIGGLIGLGGAVTAPVRWGARFLKRQNAWIEKKLSAPHIPFPGVSVISIGFAFAGAMWIYLLSVHGIARWWELLFLSIGLYFFYALYMFAGSQLAARERLGLWSPVPESARAIERRSTAELRQIRTQLPPLIAMVTVLVISLNGTGWLLLDIAMTLSHVRSERSLVFLKAPYRDMIPPALAAKDAVAAPEYAAFSGIVILFAGFGTSTAIEYADKGVIHQLDVPNDHLIIVQRDARRLQAK